MHNNTWPQWQKILFRLLFLYVVLQTAVWDWLSLIPGLDKISEWINWPFNWLATKLNQYWFHISPELVPSNGSGDTSLGWALLWTTMLLACTGSLIWSLADRKRAAYNQLTYIMLLLLRYYLALVLFQYGIIKIFALQMPFPNENQLSTPLGDLLPMRFAWMFFGYSAPYQAFTGFMETIAGLLLFYRNTVRVGLLLAFGVFLNVMMINLCYDVPVKIFSIHLVFYCLVLLAWDYKAMLNLFLRNQDTPRLRLFDIAFTKRWMRRGRLGLKTLFLLLGLGLPLFESYQQLSRSHQNPGNGPVAPDVYAVEKFVLNNDTIPASVGDSMRWKDVVFASTGSGSIQGIDTLMRLQYGRCYFKYSFDPMTTQLAFKKYDGQVIYQFRVEQPDSLILNLWGTRNEQPFFLQLKRQHRHFPLAERQFHWLTEFNR